MTCNVQVVEVPFDDFPVFLLAGGGSGGGGDLCGVQNMS